ncbi:MAG: sulfatase-like hydrolase/transferase [Shinella sp.]|nr:sulfatase-like hydrolase/transferase [Shinella sp.]
MRAISLRAEEPAAKNRLFGRGAMLMMLIVGIVPNGLFLAAMPFFIAERLISPLMYLLAAVAAFFLPPFFAYILFALVAAIDLSLIVLIAFHLPVMTALDSIRFMATIDIAASVFYIALISANFIIALLTAWLFNRYRTEMRLASPIPATVLALALVAADARFNLPYVSKADPDFDSAMSQNGLDAKVVAARGNNLLIVLVEGLGAFADPAERRLLSGKLESAAAAGHYTLTSGRTRYAGSTTSAESRELCGRWGDHLDYIRGPGPFDCLPRGLAAKGYRTAAYHGYTSDMFERDIWYPKIGFEEFHFAEDMIKEKPELVASRCGSVFLGLCDREVAEVVRSRLLNRGEQPKLVYWLTLNSHIPFVAKKEGKLACGSVKAAISNETVCELTELWGDVFESVGSIAADPRLPPTDILLVGDHHTPLWERDAKDRFSFGEVDWYFLRSGKVLREQRLAARFGGISLRLR